MKATAVANSNIALVKYWGKRDPDLMLPQNSSISVTLDGMSTRTTVEFGHEKDTFILDGKQAEGRELEQIKKPLDLIREKAGIEEAAKISSENSFPTAAGLASSASGFAALALAASKAAGLDMDKKQLSILARRGSGSASRSIYGGFVEWFRGSEPDGSDSYAEQIAPGDHWPDFRIVIAVTSFSEKNVKSRAGMSRTVANCPLYGGWLKSVDQDLDAVRKAIAEKNIMLLGKTAEHNALKMHATMMATRPAILYWNPTTLDIMRSVMMWRGDLESYFTIDAGPQVKIICMENNLDEIKRRLEEIDGIGSVIVCRPGDGASLVTDHMF